MSNKMFTVIAMFLLFLIGEFFEFHNDYRKGVWFTCIIWFTVELVREILSLKEKGKNNEEV